MIVTRRLVLRKLRMNDASILSSLMDEETIRSMNIEGRDWKNPNVYKKLIQFWRQFPYAFVIEYKNKVIGQVTISKYYDNWNLGFWIAKDFRKQGFAKEAVNAALKHFRIANKDMITAGCFKENEGSFKILTGLGFWVYDTDWVYSPFLGEYKDAYWMKRY